ncbi:MAG: mRNA cleavage and polyadenylation factor subunit [Caeruleum heppii]|nr:MAG: mRNA cleavage and polyadenylation factor subunit [Caeruleum heppii]
MQCYTELTPPTAVTHALCCSFVAADSRNLVVAKTSLLQIFALKSVSEDVDTTSPSHARDRKDSQPTDRRILDDEGLDQSFLAADVALERAERSNTTKLVLIGEFSLSGTVTSLAKIKTLESRTGAEALLVATRDAKVSLVEWDPDRHSISTVSIHYYEREDLQASPWASDLSQCISYLTVDPASRCAALAFGGRNLAILPFRQPGDDLVMDDFDADVDADRSAPSHTDARTNGVNPSSKTPYQASFVLPLSALDPLLIHPIHLSFLFEYREPTFGVLSSTVAPSISLLHERRDCLSYTVFTLDLEQRASTTILSVTNLPYDLLRVLPLPLPVGGALLIGTNELVHVDQAGKTNGVAVNTFAKECSSFGMADQATLGMKLEGCVIEAFGTGNGDLLMCLSNGELAILSFRLDGRSVSGLSLRRVSEDHRGRVRTAACTCSASLGRGRIFIGSETNDSTLLGWARRSKQATKRGSIGGGPDQLNGADSDEDQEDDGDDDHEDDLYGEEAADLPGQDRRVSSASSGEGDYTIFPLDVLPNFGSMEDLAFGRPMSTQGEGRESMISNGVMPDLELVTSCGSGRSGGLTVWNRQLTPQLLDQVRFPGVRGIWSVSAKRPTPKGLLQQTGGNSSLDLDGGFGIEGGFDRFMITTKESDREASSAVYAITAKGFEEMKGTEFDPTAGETVEVGTLGGRTRVVQVLRGEIRSYDGDLGLAQIYPMTDEATDEEPNVVSASFADPFVLIIKDDSSVVLLECDDSGDLEEVESDVTGKSWSSGCLYVDLEGIFTSGAAGRGPKTGKSNVMMFLLNAQGGLHVYALGDLSKPVFTFEGVGALPPILSANYVQRRSSPRANIVEILVADLGDRVAKNPCLMLRSVDDVLSIYQSFIASSDDPSTSTEPTLRFLKVLSPQLSVTDSHTSDDAIQANRGTKLRLAEDVNGYCTVFCTGAEPQFLLKNASTSLKCVSLRGSVVRGFSGYHTANCERGFVFIGDDDTLRVAQFPSEIATTETGWSVRRIPLDVNVDALSYHEDMHCYVLGVSEKVGFDLPKDDEFHDDWTEEDIALKPEVDQGSVKLLNQATYTVVDTYSLLPYELILCVTTLSLETSEITHARQSLVAVGTSVSRVMDQAPRGNIYIFAIIPVVPVPGQPETDRRLKLVAREECKGAVTAISPIGTQGFLLAAQGQKLMVRGLKEDRTLLPVAFMDVMCHVGVAKTLPGTGMTLMGDAVRGAWFVGYNEEPYKLTLFGKSGNKLQVRAADFLPDHEQLYIIVADADANLHVLQFDPEHPKSLSGTRLLHHTTFHTGHPTATLTLLPSTIPPSNTETATDTDPPTPPLSHQILLTSPSGSLALLTPLPELLYRRLSALQSHLISTLDHPCGLNPRAYRAAPPTAENVGIHVGTGGRGVLDGKVLGRWVELGVGRRGEVAGRLGLSVQEVGEDLRGVGLLGGGGGGGRGLGFL